MFTSLKDKVVIVTGASRGIGLAIARSLAEAGCKVGLVATNLEVVQGVAKELESEFQAKVLPLKADVKVAEEVQAVVDQVTEVLGDVDFLVNNAGITRDNLLIRMKSEEWDEVMDTNLKGPFHFARAVCKGMMKRRSGCIINISSVVGLMGNPGQANYASAKAGVIGLTKTLARELAPRNIRVNAIAPGFIMSSMTDKIPDKTREELLSKIPLGYFGEAKQVADCVLFLLSDRASYITGSVIQVDGGLNM
ncbi:MAG: 3-oxoacyl-[acyl-carrier-protein] reductase [Candidatus Cloacimonetes bacterium]|nr:3-oxoacyl-[acyl-carrier-protein] reductase [Candidatus Cloacimonadota bacterium]